MKDRIPLYPGRVTLTPVAGQTNTFDMVRADGATQPGTPMSKATFLKDGTAALFGLGSDAVPDDVLSILAETAPFVRIATYETAGAFTWTAPDLFGDGRDYEIGVWECGGGGAGGAVLSYGSYSYWYLAAGGASGRARAFKLTVTPGQTYNLVVGVGGAAAAAATSLYIGGNPGGSTSFKGIGVDGGEGGKIEARSASNLYSLSVPAAIGAQCSIGVSYPFSTVSTYLFNNFVASMNPFGGVLVPHSLLKSDGSPIYSFWNLGMVGFPNECVDPFDCTQRLSAGGSAIYIHNSSGGDTLFTLPNGLDPVTNLGGGTASVSNGIPAGDATAPGCGGGALAYGPSSGVNPSRNGAGAPGAVYIYARRAAA